MGRVLCGTILAISVCAPASASPYWVEYEPASGNFPEAEGWTRYISGGGAQRWIEDGALVIDSQASMAITDCYALWRPGELDPQAPNELFVAQWGLQIDALQGPWDPTISINSDDKRQVLLLFESDGVLDPSEGHVIATFEPGVFHAFEFRSSSMLTYELYVDGLLAHSGAFTPPLLSASYVAWGDNTIGGASLTRWDYFRFGAVVIPEPCTAWLLLASLVGLRPRG